MKQEGLQYFTGIEWIAFAFFLFLFTFIGMIFMTYRKSAKSTYEKHAMSPLREDLNNG
jgi:cbb3-type cytochrome oxidase subunit 3